MTAHVLDEATPIVEARGISKRFGGTVAVENASLALYPRQTHVLLGENGAGKSTLCGILAGALQPDRGAIYLDGREVRFTSPISARRMGIALVHQELSLVPGMTVLENLLLGNEHPGPLGILAPNRPEERERVAGVLRLVGLDVDPTAPVGTLEWADQHLVEVAKALLADPRALLLDEATAGLSPAEVDRLFAVLRDIVSKGVAVLYVTHHLEEVPRIGHIVTVMRDGRVVGTRDARTSTKEQLIELVVGESLTDRGRSSDGERRVDGQVGVIHLDGIALRRDATPIHLDIRSGEVLALYGIGQCGRLELAEILGGVRRPAAGEIHVDGRVRRFRTPNDALRAGVFFLPPDRKSSGIVPQLSVLANITLALLGKRGLRGGVRVDSSEADLGKKLYGELQIKAPSPMARMSSLSGGNQQKALIGRAIASDARVLVLNDPTLGVDVGTRREVYRLLRDLASAGRAVVISTPDVEEVIEVADRAVVLYRGAIVAEFDRRVFERERLIGSALGVHSPSPPPVRATSASDSSGGVREPTLGLRTE